jgi:hypothetical protein
LNFRVLALRTLFVGGLLGVCYFLRDFEGAEAVALAALEG